jgi:hypothetical protein
MYRMYDFSCSQGHTQEELVDVPPMLASVHCRRCGEPMSHDIIGGRSHTFKPFWHPHLGNEPVYIDSWSRLKSELQKRKLANELAS